MQCSNPECSAKKLFHKLCFENWENSLLAQMRNSARARSWSDKHNTSNPWNKKSFDIAMKTCICKCGQGCLRKDSNQMSKGEDDSKKRRVRRRSGSKLSSGSGCGSSTGNILIRGRSRTISVVSGTASSGSVTPVQPMAHSLGAVPRRSIGSDFFSDLQLICFNERHFQMEDDCPQGNDETRIFVLTSLGDRKLREVLCILCRAHLLVYDRYPLIDGTFFLSPVNHGDSGIHVKYDGKELFLMAVCMTCLQNSERLSCLRCGSSDWFYGDRLILGTMYLYDVLAVMPCCQPPCSNCKRPLPIPSASCNFSDLTESTTCPSCGTSDFHFIRRLGSVRLTDSPVS
ncbi:unnamed protein product [Soboliphyme baturini]|uniref:Headcase domain-containing protein n=1 Tax=Soboliphyme baturini TaxID=241478 RepID=A0A183IPH3_9BILA|nr:unnamed protein product [Soboliphyme baturini]